ncbi:MAG: DNA primase [Thiohalomonadaceae bacterium]
MLSEILEKVDFVALVSRKISLTKTKPDSYKGLSPFTNEKTPSFFVNAHSKTWYDFSAGKGGGVIDYVMQTENISKEGAVAFLADLVGIEIEQNHHLTPLRKIVKLSYDFFLEHAEQAYPYMKSRGFSVDTLKRYGVGFAPDGNKTLIDHLLAAKCKSDDIVATGVGYINNGRLLSRYQNRVVFPIKDAYGTIVSFTGRATDATHHAAPRYVHGASSPIFRKKEVVWNLSSVRNLIAEHNMVIVCEGQMDALSVCEAGLPGVAILGSNPTNEQIKLLAGAAANIYFVFDSDSAGEKALLEAFKVAEDTGVDSVLYSIVLPEKEDPNSYLQSHSTEDFLSLVTNARSDTSAIIRALIKKNLGANRTRSQVASAVIRELAPYVQSKLSYRGLDLVERASQEFSIDQRQLQQMIQYKNADKVSALDLDKMTFPAPIYERRILYFVLDNPSNIIEFRKSGISYLDFESSLVSKALETVDPTMDSAAVFDALKDALEEEEYYTILEFYSKGLDGSFTTALEVMRGMVLKRTRDAKNDFLGRSTPDTDFIREKRRELKEKLGAR